MTEPLGASPDAYGPVPSARRHPLAGRRRRGASASCLVLAGVLSGASAGLAWWYTTTATGATSSTAEFLPGSELAASGGGGGGRTSYASVGLGAVGGLYEAVLAVTLIVALLALAVGVFGWLRAVGRGGRGGGRRLAALLALAALLLSAALVIATPAAQPGLYRQANPSGSCSSSGGPGPCSSFWGTSGPAGNRTTWGAGAGWWASVAATVSLAAGLALGFSRARREEATEAPGETAPPGNLADPPRSLGSPPVGLAELRRLEELHRSASDGPLAAEQFRLAKARLLERGPADSAPGPGARTPLPAAELEKLKELHAAGALSDGEYDLLRRRVLLWL